MTTENVPSTSGQDLESDRYILLQQSPEFRRLRSRVRACVCTITAIFMSWFLLTIFLAGWAPGFFAIEVSGRINVGFLFGVSQVLLTMVLTAVYLSYARRRIDPLAEQVRDVFSRRDQ